MIGDQEIQNLLGDTVLNQIRSGTTSGGRAGEKIWIKTSKGSIQGTCIKDLAPGECTGFLADDGQWYITGGDAGSEVNNSRQISYRRTVQTKDSKYYPVVTAYIMPLNEQNTRMVYVGGDRIKPKSIYGLPPSHAGGSVSNNIRTGGFLNVVNLGKKKADIYMQQVTNSWEPGPNPTNEPLTITIKFEVNGEEKAIITLFVNRQEDTVGLLFPLRHIGDGLFESESFFKSERGWILITDGDTFEGESTTAITNRFTFYKNNLYTNAVSVTVNWLLVESIAIRELESFAETWNISGETLRHTYSKKYEGYELVNDRPALNFLETFKGDGVVFNGDRSYITQKYEMSVKTQQYLSGIPTIAYRGSNPVLAEVNELTLHYQNKLTKINQGDFLIVQSLSQDFQPWTLLTPLNKDSTEFTLRVVDRSNIRNPKTYDLTFLGNLPILFNPSVDGVNYLIRGRIIGSTQDAEVTGIDFEGQNLFRVTFDLTVSIESIEIKTTGFLNSLIANNGSFFNLIGIVFNSFFNFSLGTWDRFATTFGYFIIPEKLYPPIYSLVPRQFLSIVLNGEPNLNVFEHQYFYRDLSLGLDFFFNRTTLIGNSFYQLANVLGKKAAIDQWIIDENGMCFYKKTFNVDYYPINKDGSQLRHSIFI